MVGAVERLRVGASDGHSLDVVVGRTVESSMRVQPEMVAMIFGMLRWYGRFRPK